MPLEAALRNCLNSWSSFQWVDPLPLIGATTGGEHLVAGDPLPVDPLAASKAGGVHAACWRWSLGTCLEHAFNAWNVYMLAIPREGHVNSQLDI